MPQGGCVLSFCGNVIVFKYKQASFATSDRESALTFSSLSFDRRENRFLKASDGAAVASRKRSARVEFVTCARAVHGQKRVVTPCVLTTRRSEKGGSHRYSLLTVSSPHTLEPCLEFKLPYQLNGSVCILQGPTVLWSHGDSVYYTSLQAGEVRRVPIQLSHCIIGELPLHKERLFVLGLQSDSDQCSNNLSARQSLGYFVDTGRQFDGRMMLPSPYVCITRCILVLSADNVDGVLRSAVVAATSNQQIVSFEDGVVKDVCQLPFEQPEAIQLVNTGRNGCLFVVSFHRGHVCAVWKDTFQIASQWSGISSVHVDDFLRCGTDQMLLISKDGDVAEPLLDHFLLTDLCGISYSRSQDSGATTKSPPPPPESYHLALRALESRLQSGLAVLQELQQEATLTERLIHQSVKSLIDVVSGREPVFTKPEQEGLVALWDCDDESKDEASDDKTRDMPAVSSEPHVDKLWHRLAENQMVVGVILTTDGSVPLASVSLSILTEMSQSSTPAVIQTKSQVCWLPAPWSSSSSSSSSSCPASTFSEPETKRSKQHIAGSPGELNTCRLAVTAVTELTPLLNSGCVKCCVMLHYVQRQDAFSLVSNPTPVVRCCGQVVLDIQSDFHAPLLKNPELKTDEMKEDLMSLLAVLDRCVFLIDSPDHSLGDINGWIQKRVGCKRIEVSPQYLLFNSLTPSAVMLLHWHQITPFQGELTVHSSQLQMMQFLDSLLTFLPATCSVHPTKGTRQQGAARMLSLALEKEVASLRERVSLLLRENEDEGKDDGQADSLEPGSVEGLQRRREEWRRDVEKARKRLSPVVDVEKYRELTQSLSKLQLNLDLAAVLAVEQTFLS